MKNISEQKWAEPAQFDLHETAKMLTAHMEILPEADHMRHKKMTYSITGLLASLPLLACRVFVVTRVALWLATAPWCLPLLVLHIPPYCLPKGKFMNQDFPR